MVSTRQGSVSSAVVPEQVLTPASAPRKRGRPPKAQSEAQLPVVSSGPPSTVDALPLRVTTSAGLCNVAHGKAGKRPSKRVRIHDTLVPASPTRLPMAEIQNTHTSPTKSTSRHKVGSPLKHQQLSGCFSDTLNILAPSAPPAPALAASPGRPAQPVALASQHQQLRTWQLRSRDDHADKHEAFDPRSIDHIHCVKAVLNGSGHQASLHTEGGAPLGRKQQYERLSIALHTCMQEGGGAALYLSGMPGTGKSHTVAALLSELAAHRPPGTAPPIAVHINCMALADPGAVCAALLRGVTSAGGPACAAGATSWPPSKMLMGRPDEAYKSLLAMLQLHGRTGLGGTQAGCGLVVIVLDEVDRLADKAADELYRLFMLPYLPGVHMALIAIANSLDFTDRTLPKLLYRNCQPKLLQFPAYDRAQVQAILSARLASLPWVSVFDATALEMAARNVANNSGDLRHAIKACCLAVDILHQMHSSEGTCSRPAASDASLPGTVGVRQVAVALQQLAGSSSAAGAASTVSTIVRLPVQQQMVLLAVSKATAIAQEAKKKKATAVMAGKDEEDPWGQSLTRGGCSPFSSPAFSSRRSYEAPLLTPSPAKSAGRRGSSSSAGWGRGLGSPGSAGGSCSTSSVLGGGWQVTIAEARLQYTDLCRELMIRPAPAGEFMNSAKLLDSSALLRVSGTKLGLRVTAKDINAALKDNVVYKKLFPMVVPMLQTGYAAEPPAAKKLFVEAVTA